jgi:hypothetical protein
VIPLMLFILLLIALGLCFAANRDIFSPGKFYHMSLTVYFADVFFSEQSGYVYAVCFAFILVGMFMSIVEAYTLSQRRVALIRRKPSDIVPSWFVIVLWGLSIVPVWAQWHMIHLTGGLASLATSIVHRVAEHRGLGALTMLIKLIAPINLVYFGVGLVYRKRHAGAWWLVYCAHLLVFIAVALPRGSRGFLLHHFVFMMVLYHYFRKPIKLRYALAGGAVLLIIAAFLGAVRQNITRINSVDSLKGMNGGALRLTIFSYGLMPLNVVFSDEFTEYQYGKTFLTPVTNLVPRQIWPEKFDSGGVVLTRFALGREYTGMSNMSTGIVAESILNFGYPLGLLCAFAILALAIFFMVQFYAYFGTHINRSRGLNAALLGAVYGSLAQVPGSLLVGEFANIFLGVMTRLAFLFGVILLLRLRLGRPGWRQGRCPSVSKIQMQLGIGAPNAN